MLRTVFSTFVGNVMKLSCRSFLLKKLLCLARNLILLNVGGSEDLIRIKGTTVQLYGSFNELHMFRRLLCLKI